MDSFAYVVRDRAQNRLLAYRSVRLPISGDRQDFAATLDDIILQDDLLRSLRYGSVVLGWETGRASLVPRELYDAEHRRDYLEQLTLIGLDDTVQEEWYNDLDAHLLYAANSDQLETVRRALNVMRTQHFGGGLLTAWGMRSRRLGEVAVSAAVRGGRIFVAAHRSGMLQFFNTFDVNTKDDALYFVLLAYEHCGMIPSRVPLYLCGEITEAGDIYKLLYTYVAEIRFCRYGAPPALPPEFVSLPPHVYFDLLCLG